MNEWIESPSFFRKVSTNGLVLKKSRKKQEWQLISDFRIDRIKLIVFRGTRFGVTEI